MINPINSAKKPEESEIKDFYFKEIELLQGVINRMASNSFMIKGWCLTIEGICFSLSFGKTQAITAGICISIIVSIFWFLDAFFLRTERKYRALYNEVVSQFNLGNYESIDWFNLRTIEFDNDPKVGTQWKVMWSKTLWPLYLTLVVVAIGITVASVFTVNTTNIINCCCNGE